MRHTKTNRAGFTLTEIAIVLGVIGLILGAVWAAASTVYANNRTQRATAELLTILQGYRSLYVQHPVDTADGTDITAMGCTAGFFPSDMIIGACSATSVYNPWEGQVKVYSDNTNQGIRIKFAGLSDKACNNFSNAVMNSADIIIEQINAGNTRSLPPVGTDVVFTSSDIAADCTAGGTADYVLVTFKAR